MKVSNGLWFPVVALSGVGRIPPKGEDERRAAQVLYVAARWVTKSFLVGGVLG